MGMLKNSIYMVTFPGGKTESGPKNMLIDEVYRWVRLYYSFGPEQAYSFCKRLERHRRTGGFWLRHVGIGG